MALRSCGMPEPAQTLAEQAGNSKVKPRLVFDEGPTSRGQHVGVEGCRAPPGWGMDHAGAGGATPLMSLPNIYGKNWRNKC